MKLTMLCREEGSTLAAVLMVIMVVVAVGTTALGVSQHSNDVTSVDRERLQALQAAEAGAHDAMRRLEGGSPCDSSLSGLTQLSDSGGIVSSYRTRIDPTADPLTCMIHSWGFAATGGSRAMRQVQVEIQRVPQDGFAYTIFAQGGSGSLEVWNTGLLQGDAYAEALDQNAQKNKLSAHNFVSPGTVTTQNNAAFSGTVWVGGNLVLGAGSTVGKSVIAAGAAPGASGTIDLGNNSVVGADARARSTITLGNGAVVHGSVVPNDANVKPPPNLQKPAFDPNHQDITYTTQGTASQVSSALNANKNALSGAYRSTGTGTVSLPSSAKITGDLMIVSGGKVSMTSTTLTGDGLGPHRVVIVSLATVADAISANQFKALLVHTLLYASSGGIELKNSVEMTGSIYANEISLKNSYALFHSQELRDNPPPGFTFDESSATEFLAVPRIWREIVPGTPPA